MARFTDKIVVVTGAAQGIGRRVAERVADEGGKLALIDRSDLADEVAAGIRAKGGEAIFIAADLEQWDGAQKAMTEAVEAYGRIDILINNVGGTIWTKPFEHYAPEEIQAEVQRSLFPTLWCCRAALPTMLERESGVIVNVSSIATRSLNRVPYAAAKGGVNAITASLAWEVAERGVRVVASAPGGTEAPARAIPRHPGEQDAQEQAWYQQIIDQTVQSSLMKRYGTLDEQAGAILFLASDDASYITGLTLPVGGGDLG
ncbi:MULTISPECIES: benzoate diol dehydrogenase BenD [Actibacterium]|uniref:Dihydroxycyclohexadiene carboxylate dehydrogenase n=1 Tax=Actibacterium naphthalenivorans TaxID=1614693 RepID=A0A840CFQ0_9RHOB|nr:MULTISPECIES: benzoate diol dehydrogenase BenD [Actibacterium]ALG91501.1 1,6-dihydroxycyclohexa-2,4-diene-1-carboxylate dehydrogenase [Actibacterium sp. EMB200-NS6]MBB4022942.1 dihydroxycyclohexadiene carboxylate dehydrogenase [Actibacterium naphthalenivorans]